MNTEQYAPQFYKACLRGIRPDPDLTVTQWADRYRILPKKSSAEPGRYRSTRTPYAREIMDALSTGSPVTEICVMKGTQLGFALAIDTKIPTNDGWKDMSEISAGDVVFDENGNQCNVIFATEIMHDHTCYDVHFSDGNIITTDADHLWTVWDYANKKKGNYIKKQITITTEQMLSTFKKIHGSARGRNRYGIDTTQPLNLPTANLPVDPYLLGLWLGDGNSCSNRITTHKDDAGEMLAYINNAGVYGEIVEKHSRGNCVEIVLNKPRDVCQRGHHLKDVGTISGNRCRACHNIRSAKHELPPIIYPSFQVALESIGVFENKNIPQQYLRASKEQRLNLLQGLMDTDGHITKEGYCEWYSIDDRLTNQVMELIVSLGLKPFKKKKGGGKLCKIYQNKEYISKPINRITFMAFKEMPAVRLRRKKERLKSIKDARSSEVTQRRITDIVMRESVPVKCIQVDSENRLYLCGLGMIPTHNTELGNNWFGYVVDITPGPMMMVFPTGDLARDHSKQKMQPTINETPRLKEKIRESRSRDSGNTIDTKEFPGGIIFLSGSNSGAFFRSKSIRFLFLDDVDGFELDVNGEGDPAELARKRTDSYGRRKKILEVSTPTVKGISRIERSFHESDQRYYEVPCPHCGIYQRLHWGGKGAEHGLKFTRGESGRVIDVWYRCSACKERIDEYHKTDMLDRGRWVPTHPEHEKRGYQISSLYSPLGWVSWKQIVEEFLEAKSYKERLKTWVNTRLGEAFEETGEQPEWNILQARCEPYRMLTVPRRAHILTAGVDTQDNRLAVLIKAWGRNEESWVVYWTEIWGDPSRQDVWTELDALLNRGYEHESGQTMHIISAAIDSGGHHAQDVYNFTRRRVPKCFAIKGQSQPGKPVIGKPSLVDINWCGVKVPNGCQLWPVGSDTAKGIIYSRLKINEPGPGCYHWPVGLDDNYFMQLTAEKLMTKYVKGYPRLEWVLPSGKRNEALDCEVYSYAAALRAGIVHVDWDKLEKTVTENTPPETTNKRRVISAGVQSTGWFGNSR